MMDRAALTELAAEIGAQGYDDATASRFAVLIGDTPIYDSAGQIVVLDATGTVLATIAPLACFGPA